MANKATVSPPEPPTFEEIHEDVAGTSDCDVCFIVKPDEIAEMDLSTGFKSFESDQTQTKRDDYERARQYLDMSLHLKEAPQVLAIAITQLRSTVDELTSAAACLKQKSENMRNS